MMRWTRYMAVAALLTAAGCDDGEVFYATVYTVERVEAAVEIEGVAPDAEPADPLVERIRAEVLAEAPVAAGGGYALDYIRHNGGWLEVDTGPGGEVVEGVFFKEPGAAAIRMVWGGTEYVCRTSAWTADDGTSRTLFSIDLSEEFRFRYPYVAFTRVERLEYTLHNER